MGTWKDAVIARYEKNDPVDKYLCCSTTCPAIVNGGTTCGFYSNKHTCHGINLVERKKAYKLAGKKDKPKKAVKTKW